MRSAETVLRDVDARLDLPARRRVLLLRELRADFEDLVATLVAEGCAPESARVRALALLAPTVDDLGALTALHRPAYAHLAARVPSRLARAIELSGVGGMAVLAAALPLITLGSTAGLPWHAGVAMGAVAAVIVGHLGWHAFRIFVREDADAAGLVQAGTTQAALIGLALSVGASVTGLEAWASMGRLAAGSSLTELAEALAICTAIAALALAIGMLGLFGAAALAHAYLSTLGIEEELGRLLSAVPLQAGDDPS